MENHLFCGQPLRKNLATYITLGSMAISSSLVSSVLQERVFSTMKGTKFAEHITALTIFSHLVLGALEMFLFRTRRKGKLRNHLFLSLCTYSGLALSNRSLQHLDYSTRTALKSVKILPVMLVSMKLVGKEYTARQWSSALLLVTGSALCYLGNVRSELHYDLTGVLLIFIAMTIDAAAANFEERYLFKCPAPSTTAEVICFTSLFGSLHGVVLISISGQKFNEMQGLASHYLLLGHVFAFSLFSYFSMSLTLKLIEVFGATKAELVKSLRRLLTLLASFILFDKRITVLHMVGFSFFFFSLLASSSTTRVCML